MYLLDTNVISELRRYRPHGAVLAWLKSAEKADLHIAAITIGEIQAGIEKCRDIDPAKAWEIDHWLDQMASTYNVLPMDADIFRIWARLMHKRPDSLHEDAMIAATASAHKLSIVTRNITDFAGFDLPLINPFESRQE